MACLALLAVPSVAFSAEPSEESRASKAGEAVTEAAKKLVEMAKGAPPVPLSERSEKVAQTASRYLTPLGLPLATTATLVGFALMLFGRKLFRFSVPLYMIAFMGFIGHSAGAGLVAGEEGGGMAPIVGGLIGCVVGAGIAIPLRAAARFLIGALSGAILVFVIVQAFTSSHLVTILTTSGGLIMGGFLTFVFPAPLLIAGFSMFGAALASVGILSVATEPVVIEAGTQGVPHLAYTTAHVGGVVLAAILGGIFQASLGVSDEDEE